MPVEGQEFRPRPRRRGDRRHHLLHQHLEPHRADRGRACSRKNAVKRGLSVKPWVKTSLAPGSQVVTDYLAKAGPAEAISTRSASIWSAMAAPPASAIPGRCPRTISQTIHEQRPGGRRGAVGQSQFRRPRQSRRARQLSRLAAAGGGLCAGRLDHDRPHHRAARHRQRRRAGLSQGHLAVGRRRSPRWCARR